jgi:hypothetical protein
MGGPGSRSSTPKRRGNIMGNMQGGQPDLHRSSVPVVGLAPYPDFFDHPKKKGKGKVRLPLICKKFPPTNIFLSGYSSSLSQTQACIESSAKMMDCDIKNASIGRLHVHSPASERFLCRIRRMRAMMAVCVAVSYVGQA